MIEAYVGAALWALVAGLLIGASLSGAAALIVRTSAPRASTRHALWTIALFATALAPALIFGGMALRANHRTEPAPMRQTAAPQLSVKGAMARAATTAMHGGGAAWRSVGLPTVPHATQTVVHGTGLALGRIGLPRIPHLARTIAEVLVAVWIAGALVGFAGLARSVVRVRGLKKRSSPLDGALADELPWLTNDGGREIYLRLSYETETPIAVGFRRPVILIPTEMATAEGLTAIESLVVHEHAHLRRYDDWTNLAQRAIERLFWFNPLVWIVGARIALEREVAADEAVVERTHDAKDYASTLWRLAREMRMPEHVAVAPGAMLTRKQISVRIERILADRPTFGPRLGGAGLGLAALAVSTVAALAATAPPLEVPCTCPNAAVLPAPAAIASIPPFPVLPPWNVAPPQHAAPPAVKTRTIVVYRTPAPGVSDIVVAPAIPVAPRPPAFAHSGATGPAPHAAAAAAAAAAASAIPSARHVHLVVVGDEAGRAAATASAAAASSAVAAAVDGESIGRDIGRQIARDMGRAFGHANAVRVASNEPPQGTLTRELVAACRGCDLSGRDLHGLDLHGITIVGASLSRANLSGANLSGTRFHGADLSRANLDNTDLTNAQFVGVGLDHTSMRNARLEGFKLVGSSITNVALDGATPLRGLVDHCTGCDLHTLDLHGADLHGVELSGADLHGVNLRGANLRGAKLVGVDLNHADLTDADLSDATLNGCDLSRATFNRTKTVGISLTGSSLP